MITDQTSLIINIAYMSGLDIEFVDADSKEAFVRDTFVIKHFNNGTKGVKTPTKDLQMIIPQNPQRFLTIRCPVSELDVTAIEIVNTLGDPIIYYDWGKKN